MKLKIISDGTDKGTRIETDDGQRIDGVVRIDWHADVDRHLATAEIELICVPVELEVAAGAVICACGPAAEKDLVCTHRVKRGIEDVYGESAKEKMNGG